MQPAAATFAAPEWPQDAWYAAAYDVEVGNRKLLARTVAGKRSCCTGARTARPVALENACWHRLLPLSEGNIEGDEVVCGYHGLASRRRRPLHVHAVAGHGQPGGAACAAIPSLERHRFVWVWTGDPAARRPGRVPDLHWNDDPAWAGDGRLIQVDCSYKLVVDNLMDLTHETFVHGVQHRAPSGGRGAVRGHPRPGTVTVTRWMIDVEPPPFWAQQLEWKTGKPPGNVDRWQIIHFEAPCTIAIDVGVAPTGTGAPEGDRSQGVNGFVLNTMTPESDQHCHYFWAFVRNYALRRPADHDAAARGGVRRLRRGRGDPRGPAAGHRRAPRQGSSTTSTSTAARCGRGA